MLVSSLTLLAGLAMLIGGGALLLRGACSIATKFGMSPLVVGLTIVSFGTSAPELLVNVLSAASGATGLAFGNVVGSNITNLSLVLGASAVMAPVAIRGQLVRREVPLLLFASTVVTVMASDVLLRGAPAVIDRADALVLFLVFLIFLYVSVLDVFGAQAPDPFADDIESSPLVPTGAAGRWHWLSVMLGTALLFLGGQCAVDGALQLSTVLGLSEVTIGVVIVAVGTSMPELVTSVMAAMRKESDLALGNVVGSNLFNTLFVLPVTSMIAPIVVPAGGLMDLAVSWTLTALLIPVFLLGRARLGRGTGVLLLLAYVIFLAFTILMGPAR